MPDPTFEHALCAWWNSTPGILTLLNSRAKKLNYPRFSLDSLRSLLVPDPSRVDITPLAEAFAVTRGKALNPWPQMHDCPTRAAIDQAAARVLRIDGRTVADWRRRIACEPTVSGVPHREAAENCRCARNRRIPAASRVPPIALRGMPLSVVDRFAAVRGRC